MLEQEMERLAIITNLMFLKRFKIDIEARYQKFFSISKFRFFKKRRALKEFKEYIACGLKYGNPCDKSIEILERRLYMSIIEMEEGKEFAMGDVKLIYNYLIDLIDDLTEKEKCKLDEIDSK